MPTTLCFCVLLITVPSLALPQCSLRPTMPSGQIRNSRNLVQMALHHYLGAEGFRAWEKSQPHTQELASLSTDTATGHGLTPSACSHCLSPQRIPGGRWALLGPLLLLKTVGTGGFRDLSKMPQLLLRGTRIPGQAHTLHGSGPGNTATGLVRGTWLVVTIQKCN